jgi:hypothetical protein
MDSIQLELQGPDGIRVLQALEFVSKVLCLTHSALIQKITPLLHMVP